jgi:hypothetical protein
MMAADKPSTAIMKLCKLQAQRHSHMLCACSATCSLHPSLFILKIAAADSSRKLSNVVYALFKAPQVIRQQHQAALQQQLVPASMAKCAGANAQDISNLLYAWLTVTTSF